MLYVFNVRRKDELDIFKRCYMYLTSGKKHELDILKRCYIDNQSHWIIVG